MIAAGCAAIVLGLAACGGGDGDGSHRLSLVIGNELPLSGPSKALGKSGSKASALAVAEIRHAIGAADADHAVRTIQRDQGGDPASAAAAAKELVDGGASCLTGPWSEDAVKQTANDVAIPSKVLEISPVATSRSVAELNDHDLVDSTALPQSLEGAALSSAIDRDLAGAEGRTVNVAARNDTDGDTVAQDFIQDWQDRHGTVGGQVRLSPPYSSQAEEITAGTPDATVLIEDLNGFSQLAPALSGSPGWTPQIAWGSDQLVSPGLPRQVGRAAVEGMRALAPGIPQGRDASSAFVSDFRSADPRGVKLGPFAAQEFDATVLCYLAAVAAGSTDGQKMADELIDITAPGGEVFSWQQLAGAIQALQDGKDIDYTGASGPIDMDVHGDPTSGVFDVFRYTRTGLEVVGEVSLSKPNPAVP